MNLAGAIGRLRVLNLVTLCNMLPGFRVIRFWEAVKTRQISQVVPTRQTNTKKNLV